MATIQARHFVLTNGNEPTNCTVDTNTNVQVELIITSGFAPSSGENLTMLQAIVVQHNTNNCVKSFQWTGSCLLVGTTTTTYTISTVPFTLPAGSYDIQVNSNGSPSNTGTECSITIPLGVCI